METLNEEGREKQKESFSMGMDFAKRNHYEYIHEYIMRVRPFGLNAYVKGISEGNTVCGYVEAFYADEYGDLSMVIRVQRCGPNEHALYIDTEDFKTFEKVEML